MSTRYQPDAGGVWRRPGFSSIAFSDGDEVEQRLHRIVCGAARRDTFSAELKAGITDWPSEYHLSRARHCLLRPLDIKAGDKVLEVGCGCGALTRHLGERGAEVAAIEGGAARARIAAARCRDLPNVRVLCEDFLEFESEARFNWVVMVGVVEYAPMFSDRPLPMAHYFETAQRFLAHGGRLVVAIENQLGLKYFNGCSEDHVGLPFYGLENLYVPRGPATCGRRELERRLKASGFAGLQWYYPFPDYKLPSVIVASGAFDVPYFNVADLLVRAHSRDYGGQAVRAFDEALVYPVLEQNGLIEQLSSSLMVVARGDAADSVLRTNAIAWTFAVHRREEFATETIFSRDGDQVTVEKSPLSPSPAAPEARPLRVMHRPEPSAYHRGRLSIWRILQASARHATTEDMANAFLPWFDELLRRARIVVKAEPRVTQADARLADYTVDADLIDCTPFNLLEHPAGSTAIDQEWQGETPIALGQVVCRGIFHSLSLPVSRGRAYDLSSIVKHMCGQRHLSVGHEEIVAWLRLEQDFLAAVGGPVPELVDLMNCRSSQLAIYPELVRRIQEVSSLQAHSLRTQAENATQKAVLERHIAHCETARTGLARDLRDRVRQICSLELLLSSQANTLAALTRDLNEQATLLQATAQEGGAACGTTRPDNTSDRRLMEELEATRAQLSQVIRERNEAREAASALQQSRDSLLDSSSWRITAPLRALKTGSQSLTGRLGNRRGRAAAH